MEAGAFYIAVFAVGATLWLLVLAQGVRRGLAADLKTGNDAQRIAAVGEVLGVFLIAAATVRSSVTGTSVGRDVLVTAGYGALALVATTFAGKLGVYLLLGSRLAAEVARGNIAAGIAAGAQLLGSALVTSRAIAGASLGAVGLSLVFFVVGQGTLLGFVSAYRALTTYDDAEQIAGENTAAALSYAGLAIAVAVVVSRALEGDFAGWPAAIHEAASILVCLFAFYPVRQIFVQTLLLHAPLRARGGALDAAIAERRSTGMAALEAASYLATAFAIVELA